MRGIASGRIAAIILSCAEMTRQFFAFLALLSGLAALQAPAQAARPDNLPCGVQSLAQAVKTPNSAVIACVVACDGADRLEADRALAGRGLCAEIVRPALVIGIDRSHE